MILELDIGNSRCKWRASQLALAPSGAESQPGAQQQTVLQQIVSIDDGKPDGRYALLLQRIQQALQTKLASERLVERVRVCSVRSSEHQEALGAEIERCFGVSAEFAETSVHTCGVSNGYIDPAQMGVDRWSAVIAAYQLFANAKPGKAFCVADAGSAFTLDFVDGKGRHCGGYIVPGFAMQLAAVTKGADRVWVEQSLTARIPAPAATTSDAVVGGVTASLIALMQCSVDQFAGSLGSDVSVIITGGDAERLMAAGAKTLFGGRIEQSADLVLDGLRWLLP